MRGVRSIVAAVAAGVILVWLVAACGASAREKTVRASLVTTDAARVTFVAYDEHHQHAIVTEAKDEAGGKAALLEWRGKREHAVSTFEVTYRAIAAAAILADDHSLAGLLQAGKLLADELHALGVL